MQNSSDSVFMTFETNEHCLSIPSIPSHTTLSLTNKSLAFVVAQPMFQGILTNCNSVYFLSTKRVMGTVELMIVAEIENNLFPWLQIFLPFSF